MDLSSLSDLLSGESVEHLSQSVGAKPEQVEQLVTAALPTLMQGLHRNASSQEGAQALTQALEKHAKHPAKNAGAYLKEVDVADGAKAVNHILGEDTAAVHKTLAKKTGLKSSQVETLMASLAPMLLSSLGGHQQSSGVGASGLAGLLGSLMGSSGSSSDLGGLGGLAASLLGGGSSSHSSSGLGALGGIAASLLGGGSSHSSHNSGLDLGGIAASLLGGGSSHSSHNSGLDLGDIASSLLGGEEKPTAKKKKRKTVTAASAAKKRKTTAKPKQDDVASELLSGLGELLSKK